MKVLIVDDAEEIRATLTHLAKFEAAEVQEAASGAEGVRLYRSFKPDLVLMDIDMPELNGIEAARAIKRMDPDARVMMITGRGDRINVVEAYQLGIVDFLVKPFDPMRVWQMLQQQRAMRAAV